MSVQGNIGIQLKKIREKSGLTQQEFADKVFIEYRTWQRREHNGTDSIEELCFLAERLNFNLIEFLKEAINADEHSANDI